MHRMDEATRVRFERERQEKLREQIERRADPLRERRQRVDTMPTSSRLTVDQIDERIVEMINEHYQDLILPLLTRGLADTQVKAENELYQTAERLTHPRHHGARSRCQHLLVPPHVFAMIFQIERAHYESRPLHFGITRALRAASAAGQPVQRFEIDREGKIVVFVGEPEQGQKTGGNEWDRL